MHLQFDDLTLNVRPHAVHEWALTTAEVAEGYGVAPETIRYHKASHTDDLVEGKHFVSVGNPNAVGNQSDTWWTKRGVIRLGFFIRSAQARRFRDWAEDLVVNALSDQQAPSYQIEDPIERAKAWIREQEAVQALRFENAELRPQAEYAISVLDSTTALVTTKIAQELGMSAIKLNKLLADKGVQYKRSGMWNLTARYNGQGYARLSTFHHTGTDGKVRTEHSLVWTERGRQFIHRLINPNLQPITPAIV